MLALVTFWVGMVVGMLLCRPWSRHRDSSRPIPPAVWDGAVRLFDGHEAYAHAWLHSPNPSLDWQRPIDVHEDDALELIEALEHSLYL